MANLALVRVDTRLVHGQVVLKWRKTRDLDRIIIVDDNLAKDQFMADFYRSSAPSGTVVEIYSQQDAIDRWNENQFGDGNVGLLFKDVTNGYKLFKKGLTAYPEFIIGNVLAARNSVRITKNAAVTKEEYEMLKEMHEAGVEVYIQATPDYPKSGFETIAAKFK